MTRNKFLKRLLHRIVGRPSTLHQRDYIGQMDGVLDFRFHTLVKKFIANESLLKPRRLLEKLLEFHYSRLPESFLLPTFLDNHDVNRFVYECDQDVERFKEAARLQFSTEQPKIIYYGTETGMTQRHGMEDYPAHGDLRARKPMNWDDRDGEMLEFYKNLVEQSAE